MLLFYTILYFYTNTSNLHSFPTNLEFRKISQRIIKQAEIQTRLSVEQRKQAREHFILSRR